jgi:hypothetical protein
MPAGAFILRHYTNSLRTFSISTCGLLGFFSTATQCNIKYNAIEFAINNTANRQE